MGNCDPYSDPPEPWSSSNHSLLGPREPTLLCNYSTLALQKTGSRAAELSLRSFVQ
jgi:hypothetical protein